jgi:hypothetical protein
MSAVHGGGSDGSHAAREDSGPYLGRAMVLAGKGTLSLPKLESIFDDLSSLLFPGFLSFSFLLFVFFSCLL